MEYGIGLGSNMGDRMQALAQAAARIARLPDVRILARSAVYETEPVGAQPEFRHLLFLNAVLVAESAASPDIFAASLRAIETEIGRVRQADRNAPRVVDIDLIYAGNSATETERLALPHPRWAERRFVVAPLADVRPDLVLPGQTRCVSAILADLPARPTVVRFGPFPNAE